MALDTKIFGKKTVSDLFKEIYDNSRVKDRQISELIKELNDSIDDIQRARTVVPLIKEYLEISVKNDEHLLKMVSIIQKMENGTKESAEDLFNPEELARLLEESNVKVETVAKDNIEEK